MKMLEKFREWAKENTGWELICDMENSDQYYETWSELPKKERMSWIGTYGRDAKKAWREFGTRRCKVITKYLSDKLEVCDKFPAGEAMMIFCTGGHSPSLSTEERE